MAELKLVHAYYGGAAQYFACEVFGASVAMLTVSFDVCTDAGALDSVTLLARFGPEDTRRYKKTVMTGARFEALQQQYKKLMQDQTD